ncbi:MAG TPA: hypothetical protein PKD54_12960, partial [Pirellulaceae bacterium]|nr:hypothetical protein [Pirellulaceae bacterium]
GVKQVVTVKGGINAWIKAGLRVVQGTAATCGPHADACTHEAACQGQAVFWNAKCPDGASV